MFASASTVARLAGAAGESEPNCRRAYRAESNRGRFRCPSLTLLAYLANRVMVLRFQQRKNYKFSAAGTPQGRLKMNNLD